MAVHFLYTVLVMAIVAVFVNCSAMMEQQKAEIREKLKANAMECGKQHGVTMEQAKQWKEEKKTPDDSNKCFFACMFKKSGFLNEQGMFEESAALKSIIPYVPDMRKGEVVTSIKACSSVNDQPVGDGAAGCDRAVLLFKCLQEQKDLLDSTLE